MFYLLKRLVSPVFDVERVSNSCLSHSHPKTTLHAQKHASRVEAQSLPVFQCQDHIPQRSRSETLYIQVWLNVIV